MPALDVMQTGIYAIEHSSSGRMYIGSAINFSARWRVHRCLLRKGKHHSTHLQSAWNMYGEAAFLFKRLVVCSKENMLMYEQRLIDGYRVFESNLGFNGRRHASSQLGLVHSEETRAKIKAKRATQVFSQETKDLWSKNRTGRKMPEWFGEFTRQHRTGFKHTDAAKALMLKASSKLTQAQANDIRARYAAGGITQSALAKEFSLNPATISHVITGKTWSQFSSVS